MQSCRKFETRRWRSFRDSIGALIVRCPPLRFGIWKVVYFVAAGCLYRMNDTAFGLKSSSFATSLSDVAAFRLASLDLDMLQEARVTHRCSYAIVMRTMGIWHS